MLPVLDVLGGVVVRGVGGRRSEYRPWISPICPTASVAEAAQAFAGAGFSEVYLADLDALSGRPPNLDAWRTVAEAGLGLWLDAGAAEPDEIKRLAKMLEELSPRRRLILPLERLAGPLGLTELRAAAGDSGVFSLDLRGGRPNCLAGPWRATSPEQIAEEAIAAGFATLIVLDVAAVGGGGGIPTLELCTWIKRRHPGVTIVSGGGVRGVEDLRAARDAEIDRVLAASCLHDGATPLKITD